MVQLIQVTSNNGQHFHLHLAKGDRAAIAHIISLIPRSLHESLMVKERRGTVSARQFLADMHSRNRIVFFINTHHA